VANFSEILSISAAGGLAIGFCKIAKGGISVGTNSTKSGEVFSERAPFLLSVLSSWDCAIRLIRPYRGWVHSGGILSAKWLLGCLAKGKRFSNVSADAD